MISASQDIDVNVGGQESAIKFTGSQINYYFICKRKLWLFSHNIELEQESDLVKLGKLLHENRYQRKMKEVQVDRIKVDFMETKRTLTNDRKIESTAISPITVPVTLEREKIKQTEGREIVIHEVKRSKKLQDAHLYQLLYYMYYLKKNYGVNASRGVLHYPLLKQNVDVSLTEEKIKQLEEAMRGITDVNSMPNPPEASRKGYCRSCAYQDLCWG
ncbi:MAG: CRISPR-associated protein Cas4 [Nitrososphaerales archaeon]